MDGHKDVTSTCMVTTRTLAVSHIWGTNHMVMLGYDWGFLSISYTYQIHFIHIKVVWHTLYDVDGHQNAPTLSGHCQGSAVLYVTSGY